MYGCIGEGSEQMYIVLRGLRQAYHLRTNPLLLVLLTLQAEIIAMKTWVRNQAHLLMNAHVGTGHHAYANTVRQIDAKRMDLATLSRDVCGLAVNVTTSVLCMQRIVKLADFIISECNNVVDAFQSTNTNNQSLGRNLVTSNAHIVSRTQAWRIRADSLLDEAESWKHKVSTLSCGGYNCPRASTHTKFSSFCTRPESSSRRSSR